MSICDSQLVSSHLILPKISTYHILHAHLFISQHELGMLQQLVGAAGWSGEDRVNRFTLAVQGTQTHTAHGMSYTFLLLSGGWMQTHELLRKPTTFTYLRQK